MSRPSLLIVCVLVIGALLPDCVDTSALDYVPPSAEGGSGSPPACIECLTGQTGPCAAEYARCLEFPVCEAVMQCLIDKGCVLLPNPNDRVSCGLPCAQEHGLLSGSDPAIEFLASINVCGLANCLDDCKAP
jgi:hypothetical protein